ncbi:MAG: BON domain-containing protein [Nitrosomonas sp.]|uniref:BON domain-containing protein n=1 Tax=Nitrosomonas sp. TaxID=42353 RepID=UPI0025FCC280|nr:BON domain-containing protein [Nitrosomonas sp.]MBY0473890.1 BON domain-containing protein [Nitrosomonas sp.]
MTQLNNRFLTFILSILMVLFLSANFAHAGEAASEAGEYIDDTVITTKVKAEIFNEPTLKTFEISVETTKGVVNLSGSVSSQADIDRAVEITRRVSGVTAVENNMSVK